MRTPPHIFTLIFLSGSGVVAMNIYLPVLPLIAQDLGVSDAASQAVLTIFLSTMALAQLFISPLSDRFGRRPVILYSSILFLFGTILSFLAPTFEFLLLARALQSASATFMVLSRAIIRDLYPKDKVASMIGYLTMAMAIMPMISPAIGGYAGELWGWRFTFASALPFAIISLLLVYFDLGETNTTKSVNIGQQFSDILILLREKRIWGYYLTSFFTAGAYFAFLGGSPFIAFKVVGMTSPAELSLYFILVALGYILGNFCAGLISSRIGIEPMMVLGGAISTIGTIMTIVLMLFLPPHIFYLFGPMFIVALGNGMVLPNSLSGALAIRPELAGSISGLGGFIQFGGGTLIAMTTAPLLTLDNEGIPLYLIMFLSSILATIISIGMLSRRH